MIRRWSIRILVAVAAVSLLSTTALEANLTTAANIAGIAAIALPALGILIAVGYWLTRLGIQLARSTVRRIRSAHRTRQ